MTPTSLLSAAASLAAVLLLVLLAGRILRGKRWTSRAPNSRLHVEDSLALDPRRRLLLVRCDGRSVVLLLGARDQVVGWLPEQAA